MPTRRQAIRRQKSTRPGASDIVASGAGKPRTLRGQTKLGVGLASFLWTCHPPVPSAGWGVPPRSQSYGRILRLPTHRVGHRHAASTLMRRSSFPLDGHDRLGVQVQHGLWSHQDAFDSRRHDVVPLTWQRPVPPFCESPHPQRLWFCRRDP